MPKVGMEPIRRAALVEATIATIGEVGSLDVTVSQIARRAGMSSALAHHYFGGKDQIFLAAMRQILRDYSAEVRKELARTTHHDQRAEAIIRANFADSCFDSSAVSAWMTFYGQAQTNVDALRLLTLYQRRLQSNLVHALRGRVADPENGAELLAALIDGLYIRVGLTTPDQDAEAKAMALLALLTGCKAQ